MTHSTSRLLRRKPVLTLVALGLLVLGWGLGTRDLQDWDEALYAVQTLAIVQEGQWLEQSSGSIGGLWTASHPPLTLWGMALSCRIFGVHEWSLRLPAALAGVICLLVVYGMGRDLLRSREWALVAAVLVMLVPVFVRYARMAQLDIPVLLWILLTFFLFRRGSQGRRRWFLASGIALGFGLLSKLAVALLAPMSLALFVAWEFFAGPSKDRARNDRTGLAISCFVGLCVAAPWFILVTFRLGESYWTHAWGYHVWTRILRPLEGHDSNLWVLYWPNEIVKWFGTLFPLLLLGFVRVHFDKAIEKRDAMFLLAWLAVPGLLFTVTATKFLPYLLLYTVPLVFYATTGLRAFIGAGASGKYAAFLLPLSVASLVWAQTRPLHRSVGRIVETCRQPTWPASLDLLALAAFIAATLLLTGIGRKVHQRLSGDARVRWFRVTIAFVIVAAAVPSLAPLRPGRRSWIEMQQEIRGLSPRSVVLWGHETPANRYYLQSMGGTHPIEWQILKREDPRDGDHPVDSELLVVETGIHSVEPGTGPAGLDGYTMRFRSGELLLYEKVTEQEFSEPESRDGASATSTPE